MGVEQIAVGYQDKGYGDWYSDDPEDFDSGTNSRSRFAIPTAIASLLVSGFLISTTLGATININGGEAEFGQGRLSLTTCDSDITVVPTSLFQNISGIDTYLLKSLKVSDINSSANHCSGKDFHIKVYYKDQDGPQNIIDSTSEIVVRDFGSVFKMDAISGAVLDSTDNTSFTLNFDSTHTLLDSTKILQITLESKDHKYTVGDSGPGAGIIFYISNSPFACGPNLSDSCNALEYTLGGSISGDANSRWAPSGQETIAVGAGARNTAVGGGYSNSLAIVDKYTTIGGAPQSTYQAGKSRLFTGGGLNDWYMPSIDEIIELHKYAVSNSFNSSMAYYNSSTEVSANQNWGLYFPYLSNSPTQTGSKLDNNPTWPIRSFLLKLT